MNLLLFILTLLISVMMVRIGAIAFQLTGLEKTIARFQSLSCFTGTGFTTSEAELIVGFRQRRKIATVLMIAGHAGLVALMATFANSIRPGIVLSYQLVPLLPSFVPAIMLPWVNLVIMLGVTYFALKISSSTKYGKRLTAFLRKIILKSQLLTPVPFQELPLAAGGYGVVQFEVDKGSRLIHKTLAELQLNEPVNMVLLLERKQQPMYAPAPATEINAGDRLTCFGVITEIRQKLYQPAAAE